MTKQEKVFQFRTRETYKRVKALNREQLEEYIGAQINKATENMAVGRDIYEREQYYNGWNDCNRAYQQVLHRYVDELLDSTEEILVAAVEATKGIGQTRGQQLLSTFSDLRAERVEQLKETVAAQSRDPKKDQADPLTQVGALGATGVTERAELTK